MNIERINPNALINQNIASGQEVGQSSNFGNILDSAISLFDDASRAEHELTQIQMDYITGQTDDMLAVMMAEQRAHTAVTFTTQITSRVLDAYRQIMNMQV